jgi:hypothetical protein
MSLRNWPRKRREQANNCQGLLAESGKHDLPQTRLGNRNTDESAVKPAGLKFSKRQEQ